MRGRLTRFGAYSVPVFSFVSIILIALISWSWVIALHGTKVMPTTYLFLGMLIFTMILNVAGVVTLAAFIQFMSATAATIVSERNGELHS